MEGKDEDHVLLSAQAATMESILPRIMRRLFTFDIDHPVNELPVTQLRVCSFLLTGPSPISLLAEELGFSVSAATQIADRLERAGLVERAVDHADRRIKNLSLTARGSEMMRERRRMRVERAEEALSQLPQETRAAIVEALDTMLETSLRLPFPVPMDGDKQG